MSNWGVTGDKKRNERRGVCDKDRRQTPDGLAGR